MLPIVPASFVGHWSAAIPMMKNEAPLYEYACHERNYGMHNLLVSARSDDETAQRTLPPANGERGSAYECESVAVAEAGRAIGHHSLRATWV